MSLGLVNVGNAHASDLEAWISFLKGDWYSKSESKPRAGTLSIKTDSTGTRLNWDLSYVECRSPNCSITGSTYIDDNDLNIRQVEHSKFNLYSSCKGQEYLIGSIVGRPESSFRISIDSILSENSCQRFPQKFSVTKVSDKRMMMVFSDPQQPYPVNKGWSDDIDKF